MKAFAVIAVLVFVATAACYAREDKAEDEYLVIKPPGGEPWPYPWPAPWPEARPRMTFSQADKAEDEYLVIKPPGGEPWPYPWPAPWPEARPRMVFNQAGLGQNAGYKKNPNSKLQYGLGIAGRPWPFPPF
ncbi:uncharacterized protein LOC144138074 [Haemaphysalis longicornis]